MMAGERVPWKANISKNEVASLRHSNLGLWSKFYCLLPFGLLFAPQQVVVMMVVGNGLRRHPNLNVTRERRRNEYRSLFGFPNRYIALMDFHTLSSARKTCRSFNVVFSITLTKNEMELSDLRHVKIGVHSEVSIKGMFLLTVNSGVYHRVTSIAL